MIFPVPQSNSDFFKTKIHKKEDLWILKEQKKRILDNFEFDFQNQFSENKSKNTSLWSRGTASRAL